ncbi:MAG TPA: hypothetical protein PKE32_05640 [Miltoncostaeaceae bacterium]|nr:hypothetical protein [Miltoncostaeaceae bacterium]
MNEAHFAEIEKVLLYISDARERAENTRKTLEKGGAEAHLIAAVRESEDELARLHKRLLQQTHFAVPKPQMSL